MPIRVEHDGSVSWVIIDREERGNSLDLEHALQLARALKEECSSQDTSVVALRGAGERFFSTGVDLDSVASVEGVEDALKLMGEGLGGVCRAIVGCEKPVVAAVNGHAVGIGFEMVVASDLAYAVRRAKMGSPATRWGMVPPATPTIGQYVIGYKAAAEIVLTARLYPAEHMYKLGLLNGIVETVDELVGKVRETAESIASNSKWAVQEALRVLRASRPHHLTEVGIRSLILSTARAETRNRVRDYWQKRKG